MPVKLNPGYSEADLIDLLGDSTALGQYTVVRWVGSRIAVLDASNDDIFVSEDAPAALAEAAAIRWVSPLFFDPTSQCELMVSDELIVSLKDGVLPQDVLPSITTDYRSFLNSSSTFILSLDGGWAEMLAAATTLGSNPQVRYAEPNTYAQVIPLTNDTLYAGQWTLNNTGQSGGVADADVDAPEAWSTYTGSEDVVIAIIDWGIETDHPDLADNMFYNQAEVNGSPSVDDDNNGYEDDFCGWDFVGWEFAGDGDNDPNPALATDNHGTAVAGIAAAVGDNETGVTGIAQHSRILPIRIDESVSAAGLAAAVYYAGGVDAQGGYVWRGADIINCSWGGQTNQALTDAFDTVAEYGRGGLGTVVFAASGNDATGYRYGTVDTSGYTSGHSYFIQWEYSKDPAGTGGDDSVWLANVSLPTATPTVFRFDDVSDANGWFVAGDAPWSLEYDPSHAYGVGRYQLKAGDIDNSEVSILRSPTFTYVAGNDITFEAWISTEKGTTDIEYLSYPPNQDDGDWLIWRVADVTLGIWVDGGFLDAGFPGNFRSDDPLDPEDRSHPVTTAVTYPASLPSVIAVGASTDCDYRADYSQYGAYLDFVAPSGGGFGAVTTTDRTGDDGYNQDGSGDGDSLADTDYTSVFGGTSCASPLAAGIAALMLSKHPGLTGEEIRGGMQASADQIGGVTYTSGFNSYYGYGRVNAQAALDMISDAPASVALLAISDTGVYDNDRLTKLDNSDEGEELEFHIEGVTAGATVKVYADGVEIGWAEVGAGVTYVDLTTNGTVDLSNDQEPYSIHTITARQTVPDKLPSAASSGLDITVDAVAPTVLGFNRGYLVEDDWDLHPTTLNTITIQFSENVSDTLGASDLTLWNLTSSTQVTLDPAPSFSYDAQTNKGTWDFGGLALTASWYEVLISGTGVTDIAGNALDGDGDGTGGDDYSYGAAYPQDDMLIPILGDANLDGAVGYWDLQILMANYGQSGKNWSEGDFTYDGYVGSADYMALKQHSGMSLSR